VHLLLEESGFIAADKLLSFIVGEELSRIDCIGDA